MLAVLLLAAGCALPPALAVGGDYLELGPQLEVVLDPARSLQLEQLQRPPACSQFTPAAKGLSFGVADSAAWLRFRPEFSGQRSEPWRLVLRFTGLERACVHWPLRSMTGARDCRARGQPGWDAERLVFAFPVDYDARRPIHIEIDSKLWLKAPLELVTVDALLERDSRSRFGWGLYYGLLATIILVSFVAYAGGRERAFLYFSLQLAGLTLTLALWQGQFAAWDPPAFSLTRLAPIFVCAFLALGVRFFSRFLETGRHAAIPHRLLEVCFWAALALAPLQWFWPVVAVQALAVLALAWLGAVLWASIARARQGYRPALTVLGAVSVLLAAIFANALEAVGLELVETGLARSLAYAGTLLASLFLVLGLLYRVRDLTEERNRASELAQANQQLALRRARYDELTGLPNRFKFREDVQQRLLDAMPEGKRLALVTIGLDKFRAINHALGHEGGDQVLIEITMRLRQAMQQDDVLARIGPDMFGWLTALRGGNVPELKARCALLRKTLASPLLSGRGSSISASLGVSLFPQHATTADPLLRASDEALYRAKDLAASGIEIFEAEMRRNAQLHLQLSKDLHQALIRDELELYYQPLVSMDRNELVGVEALLRWQRQGKFVPPDQFIPIAESTDLIMPLTDWVFRRAMRQYVEWQRRQIAVPSVSVNISPHQFRLPGFAERVEAVLHEYGVGGEAVVLEITESALLDDMQATRATLMRLRERGVRVAVDDFGVGYSSLSYLRTLPVQSVKIDRSFLQGVPAEAEAVSVINAIIALGRDLGLKVTAEGIETQEQSLFLASRGTDIGQGYLFARPMPAAALENWIAERRPLQGVAA